MLPVKNADCSALWGTLAETFARRGWATIPDFDEFLEGATLGCAAVQRGCVDPVSDVEHLRPLLSDDLFNFVSADAVYRRENAITLALVGRSLERLADATNIDDRETTERLREEIAAINPPDVDMIDIDIGATGIALLSKPPVGPNNISLARPPAPPMPDDPDDAAALFEWNSDILLRYVNALGSVWRSDGGSGSGAAGGGEGEGRDGEDASDGSDSELANPEAWSNMDPAHRCVKQMEPNMIAAVQYSPHYLQAYGHDWNEPWPDFLLEMDTAVFARRSMPADDDRAEALQLERLTDRGVWTKGADTENLTTLSRLLFLNDLNPLLRDAFHDRLLSSYSGGEHLMTSSFTWTMPVWLAREGEPEGRVGDVRLTSVGSIDPYTAATWEREYVIDAQALTDLHFHNHPEDGDGDSDGSGT